MNVASCCLTYKHADLIRRNKNRSLRYYYSVLTLSKRYSNKCVRTPKWHSRKFHFCSIPKAAFWSDSDFIVCRIWGQVTSGFRKSIDWRLGVRKPTHGSLGDEEVVWDRRKWKRGVEDELRAIQRQPAPASPVSVRTRQNTTALREIKRRNLLFNTQG